MKLSTVPEETPAAHPSKYQRTQQPPMGPPRGGAPFYGAYGMAPPPPQPQAGYNAAAGYAAGTAYGAAAYGAPHGQQHPGQMVPPSLYGNNPYAAAPQAGGYAPAQGGPYSAAQGSYGAGRPAPQSAASGAFGVQGAGAAQVPPAASCGCYSQSGYSFAGYSMDSGGGSGGGGAVSSAAGANGGGGGMARTMTWSAATPTGGPDGEMMQLIPSMLAGRLIGKGGSGIREMREMSHANIRILSDCEPGTDQRKLTVSGAPEAIGMALTMISQRLAQGP